MGGGSPKSTKLASSRARLFPHMPILWVGKWSCCILKPTLVGRGLIRKCTDFFCMCIYL